MASERVRPAFLSNPWVIPGFVLAVVVTILARLLFGIWSAALFVGFWCIVFEMLIWNIRNRSDNSGKSGGKSGGRKSTTGESGLSKAGIGKSPSKAGISKARTSKPGSGKPGR